MYSLYYRQASGNNVLGMTAAATAVAMVLAGDMAKV